MRLLFSLKKLEFAITLKAQYKAMPHICKILLFGFLSTFWGNAFAGSDPLEDAVQVRLISASAGAGEEVWVGIDFAMKPGWKVYWRSPGDSGFPTVFDWSESENLAEAVLFWPAPRRFDVAGFQTVGYETSVVLPVRVRLADPGQLLRLRLQLDYLMCSDICVPASASLALALPAGAGAPTPEAERIERYVARVPVASGGMALTSARIETEGERQTFVAVVASSTPLRGLDAFVEGAVDGDVRGLISDAPESVEISTERLEASLRIPLTVAVTPESLDALVLTVVSEESALEAVGPEVVFSAGSSPGSSSVGGLWAILGIALLGGFILNVMPCVLPVLSLKLMGVLHARGQERAAVRRSFLGTSLGIVAAFLALGGVLAVLKAGGASVGWGLHFQSPLFLGVMIVLLTIFTLNLWGVFQFSLPGFASSLAERRTGAADGSFGSSVAGGILATLLATPCSAPFLGAAIGFALVRGPMEIGAIFLALGLGMSAPYLFVAAFPRCVAFLPKPGRWMETMRKLLGLALAGTAVWLAAVLVLNLSGEERGQEGAWQPFDRSAIDSHVASGRTVFVDISAAWCLTCKVNKALVLDQAEVAARLAASGVVAMRGDWTRRDEDIGAYMAEYGRYGVPFNIVYGPGAPQGILLSELLTREAVMTALERAGRTKAGF